MNVIEVKGLGKKYRIGKAEKKSETLVGSIINGLKQPLENLRKIRSLTRLNDEEDIVWALRDVSFEVKEGEVLGIIGHNGAGKSTLLKILSRITEPSVGEVQIKGRVAALLEVGTGFHPELTGRENVYMNGTILGMRKKEIDRKLDEIVAFSGVEKFLDTPVKFYSSGMRVRLGFSVAAHLEPEILIIDEVLAVGDAEFQRKCLGKMQDVSTNQGRTVLFVSHNMPSVARLCSKALLLKDGVISFKGSTQDTIERYLEVKESVLGNKEWKNYEEAPGNNQIKIRSIAVTPDNIDYQSKISISICFFSSIVGSNLDITLRVLTRDEVVVFTTGLFLSSNKDSIPGTYISTIQIPPHLLNAGIYKISIIFGQDQRYIIYKVDDIISFEVLHISSNNGVNYNVTPGIIKPVLEANIQFVDNKWS